jgi:uncharacterized protein YhaN
MVLEAGKSTIVTLHHDMIEGVTRANSGLSPPPF